MSLGPWRFSRTARSFAVSRIKPHTDFRGKFESGILKMLVIGLGKREGAAQHHRWGYRGLRDMLPETGKVVLERTRFGAGLAVLENAAEQTARLQVIDRDEVFALEPGLLDEARLLCRDIIGESPPSGLDSSSRKPFSRHAHHHCPRKPTANMRSEKFECAG